MREKGVLLIHGLRGSPREYILLESALQAEGYKTRAITLPGHGDSAGRRFHETSAGELLAHCLEEYRALAGTVDSVHLIGHSLGGICALMTAARRPEKLKGVITLAAPYEHAYFLNYHRGLARLPLTHLVRGALYAPECRTGFRKPEYRLSMVPRLFRETRAIFRQLKEAVPQINVPVCLAHSIYDLAIPYPEMHKLAGHLVSAPHVSTHTLDRCGHMIFPNSRERQRITRLILDFMNTEFPDFRRSVGVQNKSSLA